jgi:hypothetical protein
MLDRKARDAKSGDQLFPIGAEASTFSLIRNDMTRLWGINVRSSERLCHDSLAKEMSWTVLRAIASRLVDRSQAKMQIQPNCQNGITACVFQPCIVNRS